MKSIFSAVKAWNKAIGPKHVSIDPKELRAAEKATFKTSQKIAAVLFPSSSDEVLKCVQIACRFKVSLYPISGGQNCGYGTRVPYQDGSVILDLRRLNRILDYNEQLAYVTLEPGVTQEELRTFLNKKGGKLWIDPISTSSKCSVVGNILERGHGMTAYADRVSSACDFEVVLGNGTRIETGNRGFDGARKAKTAPLDRWRAGPNLDGLFSQSGLGIVTRMTVWLMPAPEYVETLGFALGSDQAMGEIFEALRPLRLDHTLQVGPRIVNEYRHIQNLGQYPWEEMKGKVPLSEKLHAKLMDLHQLSLWVGFVGFYGTREQVEVNRARTLRVLKKHTTEVRILNTDTKVQQSPSSDVFQRYLQSVFTGMTGGIIPAAKRPYWRKRVPPAAKFEEDGCGIMWCPISVPFDGPSARKVVDIYRKTIGGAGFEPDISISSIRERTLEVNVSIIFDRDVKGEDEKALRCSRKLFDRLMDEGFTPHRLGLHSMQAFARSGADYLKTVQLLRKAFDPNGIISPGRYSK